MFKIRFIIWIFLLNMIVSTAYAEMLTSKSAIDWKNTWSENYERSGTWLMQGDYAALDTYYNGKQKAYENGEIDEYILAWEFQIFEDVFKHPPSHPNLEKWAVASPNSYAANLVMGMLYLNYGYQFRGTKWASETTPDQFNGMQREFRRAAPYLLNSLTLADKPVLSYESILETFRSADVAMTAFAPKSEDKLVRDITKGEAFLQALKKLGEGIGLTQQARAYTQNDLHRAMWHYARQGFAIAPNSQRIADSYFDLIKPKWYGSEEMMLAFAEMMHESNVIDQKRYEQMRFSIPWDRARLLKNPKYDRYDPRAAAALYLEAASYVDPERNKAYYFDALCWYLLMNHALHMQGNLQDEERPLMMPKLTYFLSALDNPYRTYPDEENRKRYQEIVTFQEEIIKNGISPVQK